MNSFKVFATSPPKGRMTAQQSINGTPLGDDHAIKNDLDKDRMDLIPPEVEVALARILGHGAQKYEDRNWERGMDWGRVYAAARRHLNKFWAGIDIDSDSGMPHIDHALCCLAFLSTYYHRRIGLDNRPASVGTAPMEPAIFGKE